MKETRKEGVGSDVMGRFAGLSPAKQTLLRQRLKAKGVAFPLDKMLRPRGTSDLAPISFAQERLWFLDQYEPGKAFYNIPLGLRLSGRLNIEALERSINEITRRHEALRTTFSTLEGEPVQVIAAPVNCSLFWVDLSDRSVSEREDEARRLAQEEARWPFDLARGPVFRATLIRLGEDDHVLLLTMHHIVSDGWSMGVLNRELAVLYKAFCHSEPSPLSELPIQYADYAVWQREWLRGEVLDGQLTYWKKQLEGAPGVLDLPTDRPRPAVQSYRGARSSFELSKELTDQLKALSRKENATLFMTLLAAFQALLYRYTGQEDIVVGSPIANRTRVEIEGLIGFFVNTLVLRSNFSDHLTFKELLARVKETALGAYGHQDLPFEKLVEELKPERTINHSPLFQVMFVLQNAPATNLSFEGLGVSPFRIGAETAKFDLTLSMSEAEAGLRGSLQYSTDLFDDETIARMIGHWQTLLEAISVNPDQRISRLPLLTQAEQHQLLVEWNDTGRDYPEDRCIQQLFEVQVERSPDAVAVVFENEQLTYRELNIKANQLAHYLQRLGVGPEVLVGVCLERSLEMVIALLGILKAGGAYVPLDPEYPEERLKFMLEDTQAPVLLTQERLLEKLPNLSIPFVCVDQNWPQIAKEKQENTEIKTTADNVAYLIYTSGTTGKPKGMMISHHNVARLFHATEPWFHFSKDDTWTVFHSYAFDFSVWELWGALLYGGRAVIVPFWLSRSPEDFYELLRREQVTVLNQTPSAFRQLINADQAIVHQRHLSLRLIIMGGEALDFRSLQPWFHRHGDQCPTIVNMYGITETTVHVTYRIVRATDIKPGNPSLIGVPIPDLQLYVVDPHWQLVPIGVAGELYVGGAGVGRGYLNRPELTDARFIANPFGAGKAGRLYKTGDLVRRLSNGDIEYLGRIDDQVKIRGYRMELGEIELTLSQHPGVKETVVLAREEVENPKSETRPELSRSIQNLESDKRLVAYVVPKQDGAFSLNELRSFVKQKLPEHMVPSAFVFLDSFPLTANGKIDRKGLPAPDQRRPELEEGYVAPRGFVEEMIAEIWAEVLKLQRVGVYDNFFDLGGHSLLATQVMLRIGQVFKVEIPLRALFERPTVAALAERIEEFRRDDPVLKTLPILPVSREKNLPLSFAQERLWFVDQLEPNSSLYNLPGGLRLRGPLAVAALERSLNEIIRRHESLRTTFSMVDGEAVQVIAPPVKQPLALVDLRDHPEGEREEEARCLVREEARRPFDLVRGLLFRTTLVRLGEDDHVLLLTMHHIVSDGWSMGVLYGELSTLYRAFANGESSPLLELPIQYADYAVWQREWMQGEVLQGQLSYWKKQLEGIRAVQNLPIKHPRPAVQSRRGAQQSFVLSKELSEQLKTLSRSESVTLFMTLLAAFQTLLYRYTGQEDVVVNSPVANRNRPEVESLIGFFVNSLVLRADFSGDPSFRELLKRVREVCLGAYAHQEFPFQKVVEAFHLKRDNVHRSLGQVAFAFQNHSRPKVELPGLSVTPFRTDLEIAKTALTIFVRDTEEGLAGSLNYAADLFDAATISRMVEHFHALLNAVVADPDQRLLDLPPFIERSRAELLEAIEWANEQSWQFETDTTEGREQGEL